MRCIFSENTQNSGHFRKVPWQIGLFPAKEPYASSSLSFSIRRYHKVIARHGLNEARVLGHCAELKSFPKKSPIKQGSFRQKKPHSLFHFLSFYTKIPQNNWKTRVEWGALSRTPYGGNPRGRWGFWYRQANLVEILKVSSICFFALQMQ